MFPVPQQPLTKKSMRGRSGVTDAVRHAQVEALTAHLRQLEGRGVSMITVGDFNIQPGDQTNTNND